MDDIISSAADLAAHRGSSVVDIKDILLPLGIIAGNNLTIVIYGFVLFFILERNYDLGLAGFVDSESRPKVTEARYRQLMFGTEAHQVRKNQVNSNQSQNQGGHGHSQNKY